MYIFLDVDGVLNRKSDWVRPFTLNKECVKNFNDLLRRIPDAKVVLSSTWRNGISRDGTRAAHVEDLMQALSLAGVHTIDRTANAPDGSRSREIDYYLRRHERDSYIILDDDPALFGEPVVGGGMRANGMRIPNLYLVNAKYGLTNADVRRIVKQWKLRD